MHLHARYQSLRNLIRKPVHSAHPKYFSSKCSRKERRYAEDNRYLRMIKSV